MVEERVYGRRVYLAGPMAGIPEDNFPLFQHAQAILESLGAEVVNPAGIRPRGHKGPCPPGPQGNSAHTGPCHLREDIRELVRCDLIVLLPGWEASVGARLEMIVATQCALGVLFYDTHNSMVFDQVGQFVERFEDDGPVMVEAI